MSRVVGFSLKLEGSSKTISDIEKIEKALKAINDQIAAVKKADLNAFKPLIESQAEFRKAIDATNKLIIEQTKILSKIGSKQGADKSLVDDLKKQISTLRDEIKLLKKELGEIKSPTVSTPSTAGFENLQAKAKEVIESLKGFAPAIEQVAQGASLDFINKLAVIELRLKAVKDSIRNEKSTNTTGDTTNLTSLIAEEKALIETKKELTKQINAENKAFREQADAVDPTSLVGLRKKLSELKAEYIQLSKAERESAEGQRIFNEIATTNFNVSSIEQSLGDFRRNVGNYQSAVQSLIPTLELLRKEGGLANSALLNAFKAENKARIATLRTEVNKLSSDFNKLSAEERKGAAGVAILEQLKVKASQLGQAMSQTNSRFTKFGQSFNGLASAITGGIIGGGIVGAVQGVMSGVRSAIDVNKELSDIESDVRKTTGLTAQQVKQLESAFKNIDTRTSTAELLKIAAVAGQLGVEGSKGIEEFTKAINVVTVALADDLGGDVDKVSGQLAKLSNVLFGSTTNGEILAKNITNIGNSLNVLASTSAATGANIVDFASRIGRSLVPLGVSAEQVLALSATFDELNILPEQGATAVNNLIKDIGANINDFAKVLRLNKDDLEKAFNTNPLNAFKLVIDQINKLSGGNKALVLQYLKALKQTGEGVSSVFLQLSDNTSIFDRNLINATDSIQKSDSVLNEYNTKQEGLAGTLDRLNKKFTDIASNQGFANFIEKVGNKLLDLATFLGKASDGFDVYYRAFEKGILLDADFKKVDAAIKQTFGEQVSNEFETGKYQAQATELAKRLVDIQAVNIKARKEISEANNQIKFLQEFYGNTAKGEEGIKKQREIIANANAKLIDEAAYAKNFVQNVLYPINAADDVTNKLKEKTEEERRLEQVRLENQDKANKEAERLRKEHLQNLDALNKRLQDLEVEAIQNEFDKRIEKIELNTAREVKEWEKKGLLTVEIQKKFYDIANTEIAKVEQERIQALQSAKDELLKIQKEVNSIIALNQKDAIFTEVSGLTFDYEQQREAIKDRYDLEELALETQLSNGIISKKKYEDELYRLNKDRLDEELKEAQRYSDEVNKLYEEQYKAELKILDAKRKQANVNLELETAANNLKILEEIRAGRTDVITGIQTIAANEKELLAKKKSNDLEYNKSAQQANQDRIANEKKTADEITKLNIEGRKEENKKKSELTEEEKAKREALKDAIIDTAQRTADTIFQIEKAQIDAIQQQRLDNLDREKEARLKLVKGNTAEEERINREFEEKKRKLTKQNAEEQKKLALKQAVVNGALAIVKTFAQYGFTPIGAIAAAAQAVATLLQIATIKAQSFAEGGFTKRVQHGFTGASQAPPDHTGRRPVGTAVIHEGEYFANAEQVRDYRPLFDALEEDRMSRKRGFGASFRYQHVDSKLAFKAVEAHEKRQAIRGVKYQPPVLYQYTHFMGGQNMSAVISDTVIESMASRIAEKAEQAIISGVHSGYANAVKTLAETELRKVNALNKSAI